MGARGIFSGDGRRGVAARIAPARAGNVRNPSEWCVLPWWAGRDLQWIASDSNLGHVAPDGWWRRRSRVTAVQTHTRGAAPRADYLGAQYMRGGLPYVYTWWAALRLFIQMLCRGPWEILMNFLLDLYESWSI